MFANLIRRHQTKLFNTESFHYPKTEFVGAHVVRIRLAIVEYLIQVNDMEVIFCNLSKKRLPAVLGFHFDEFCENRG